MSNKIEFKPLKARADDHILKELAEIWIELEQIDENTAIENNLADFPNGYISMSEKNFTSLRTQRFKVMKLILDAIGLPLESYGMGWERDRIEYILADIVKTGTIEELNHFKEMAENEYQHILSEDF